MSIPKQSQQNRPFRGLGITLFGGLCLAGFIAMHGITTRANESKQLREWTAAQALPTVAVINPQKVNDTAPLELPGRIEAFKRAPIYARVDGYLKSWTHEIGSAVKSGELLAELDTPEIDQQLFQARADLNVAKANTELAQSTAARWRKLAETKSVAEQEVDQRVSASNAGIAQVKSAQANVNRLEVQKDYAKIVAPFDGIVTKRATDVGALIDSGSGNATALFEISDISQLRVYIRVPQNFVPRVPNGTKAVIKVPEYPNEKYEATVTSSAQSVNSESGTTLMQIIVNNRDKKLLSGGYARVQLFLAERTDLLSVPPSALIFNATGLSVASVGADNKVVIKPVTVARDLGQRIEIESGLNAADRIIANPPDGIVTGDSVRVVSDEKTDKEKKAVKG